MKILMLTAALFSQCQSEPSYSSPRELAFFSENITSKEMVPANYYDQEIKVLVINGYAPRIVEKQTNGFVVKYYYYDDKIPYKGGKLFYLTNDLDAPPYKADLKIKKDLSSPSKTIDKKVEEKIEDAPSFSLEEFEETKKELNILKEDLKKLKEDKELNIPTLKTHSN